jgi:hypothetical protein
LLGAVRAAVDGAECDLKVVECDECDPGCSLSLVLKPVAISVMDTSSPMEGSTTAPKMRLALGSTWGKSGIKSGKPIISESENSWWSNTVLMNNQMPSDSAAAGAKADVCW